MCNAVIAFLSIWRSNDDTSSLAIDFRAPSPSLLLRSLPVTPAHLSSFPPHDGFSRLVGDVRRDSHFARYARPFPMKTRPASTRRGFRRWGSHISRRARSNVRKSEVILRPVGVIRVAGRDSVERVSMLSQLGNLSFFERDCYIFMKNPNPREIRSSMAKRPMYNRASY